MGTVLEGQTLEVEVPVVDLPAAAVPDLRVNVVTVGHEVSVTGRLDVHGVADVRTVVVEQLALGTGDFVLMCSDLVVRDATALGLLVATHRRALRMGRRLVLSDITPVTARLLRSTRLHRVLATSPTSPTSQTGPTRPTGRSSSATAARST